MVELAERLSGAVRQCLDDAEAAARDRDPVRARRLLQLALDLAEPATMPMVLLAAHSVKDGLRSSGIDWSTQSVDKPAREPAERDSLEHRAEGVAEGSTLPYPMPVFAVKPPALEKHVGSAFPAELRVDPLPDLPRRQLSRPPRMPRSAAGRHGGRGGAAWVVVALVAGVVWWASSPVMGKGGGSAEAEIEAALTRGDIAAAVVALEAMPEAARSRASATLLAARAYLLNGDSVAAVSEFVRAAEADVSGAGVAWAAAEQLSDLPGAELAAADAFLLAFSAGLPPERWERVALAQEAAGRFAHAERIRALWETGGPGP